MTTAIEPMITQPNTEIAEPTLEQLLYALHHARTAEQSIQDTFKAAYEAWKLENQPLFDAVTAAKEKREQLDTSAREEILSRYKADPVNKTICPGASVRIMTSYNYPTDQALKWAKEHSLCLMLDEKAFKDLCKAESSRPEFVEVTEKPSAAIATDLSTWK